MNVENNNFGKNRKNKSSMTYTDVLTVTRPIEAISSTELSNGVVADALEVEDSTLWDNDEYESTDDSDNRDNGVDGSEYLPYNRKPQPVPILQSELSDLVRHLGLTKYGAEDLASFLKKRNLLKPETRVPFYGNRNQEYRKYFKADGDLSLAYCTNIKSLINELMENLYNPVDWRLFIDSSKRIIKAVLLHNTDIYALIPIAHSTIIK